MKLKPLDKDILFVFIDEIINGKFVEKHNTFILGQSEDKTIKNPRWGKVVAIGPNVCSEITIGAKILIEPLMWTKGLVFDNIKVWKTDESKIIGIEEII